MKKFSKYFTGALAFVLAVSFMTTNSMATAEGTPSLQDLYVEERTAQATYEKAAEQFDNARPFSKIMKAEERHASHVEDLAEEKGVALTETEITVADFKDYKEAIDKGIAIEKEDIEVLEKMLADPNLDEESRDVYELLLRGSERHLQAFQRVADNGYEQVNPGQGNAWGRGQGKAFGPGMGLCQEELTDEEIEEMRENCRGVSGMMRGRGRQGKGQGVGTPRFERNKNK